MTSNRTRTLNQFATVSVATLVLSGLYGAATGSLPVSGATEALVYAAVIGIPLVFVETYGRLFKPFLRLREWPFGSVVAIKSAAYIVWICLGTVLAARLTHPPDAPVIQDIFLHRDKLVSAILGAVAVNAILAVSRLLGPGELLRFLSGRYFHPTVEERVFVFVDLCNSTAIAEQLGDLRFHMYLADVFRAIESSALESGGEVRDYIGDQVMIVWPVQRQSTAGGPFPFVVLLNEALHGLKGSLQKSYGVDVDVRIAVHQGTSVAGEVGLVKRKITFVGDTLNTAARLISLAREQGYGTLATRPVLAHFQLPKELKAHAIGSLPLRGKTQETEVFWLEMVGAGPSGPKEGIRG